MARGDIRKIKRNNKSMSEFRREGSWYNWIHAKFEGNHKDENELFPAKVLALYKNYKNQMKALVHSMEYKKEDGKDSLIFWDSKLVPHYLQEFWIMASLPWDQSILMVYLKQFWFIKILNIKIFQYHQK